MKISLLNDNLAQICEEQFSRNGHSKPKGYFHESLARMVVGDLDFIVAHEANDYVGHVRLLWQPLYTAFRKSGIPEISDLNVLPDFRRLGIGSALIERCEQQAQSKSRVIGIGVGLYPGYNTTQRLYTRLAYVLDGRGVHYKHQPVQYGETPPFDDDLLIFFIKELSSNKCGKPTSKDNPLT